MKDFIAQDVQPLLQSQNLADFDSLWALELPAVDEPNLDRGGWSSVSRLELSDEKGEPQAFYLKRQCNHQTRSWMAPLGEPTFARELRNIEHYQAYGIPALQAAFYAQRNLPEGKCAILLTKALDRYQPLDELLTRWSDFSDEEKSQMLTAVGDLVARLHRRRITHHCLYPKHIFIALDQQPSACLIDLENACYQWFPQREVVVELESLLRRVGSRWSAEDVDVLLDVYLSRNRIGFTKEGLLSRLASRRKDKERRALRRRD